MSDERVFLLKCAVQTYDWGKPGSQSTVARLAQSGNPDFSTDETKPYAELWMGTHAKGPSVISSSGEALSDWLARHPEAVGDAVKKVYQQPGQLPFLFKVLSVNKSLSIQAHPDKAHAEKLHAERPDKYPDANHKPEMAIALTQFEGLCGFRPKEEIVRFLNAIPEFRAVVGDANAESFASSSTADEQQMALRDCFSTLMKSDPEKVKQEVDKLATRLQQLRSEGGDTEHLEGELFLRLHSQFPGDCGCFCIYFLNHMMLKPGEAMFLEANLPHAYLFGDCLECMACSDNVVRAGLTPKYKDVPTLCSMLNYANKSTSENLFPPQQDPKDDHVTVYNPPVPDFGVNRIKLSGDVKDYTLSSHFSASISIVTEGSATTKGHGDLPLKPGSVLFAAAERSVDLTVGDKGLCLFRAYCSL